MTGYGFHPEAEIDLDEIWEYIAADNVNAADRESRTFNPASKVWWLSRIAGIADPI